MFVGVLLIGLGIVVGTIRDLDGRELMKLGWTYALRAVTQLDEHVVIERRVDS
jgi:hypothetical protein